MKNPFRHVQLYNFLFYCNQNPLEKVVLDCGAGGERPPLALFAEYGYKTLGIEIDDAQLDKADKFQQENNLDLGIAKGDIRELPFENESISFIYSYNTIFHMTKAEIGKAIAEMSRVLKPGGYLFVNFVSTDDMEFGDGEKSGHGEYIQKEHGTTVLHSYFDKNEAEGLFGELKVLFKEVRVREGYMQQQKVRRGFIDYILEKSK